MRVSCDEGVMFVHVMRLCICDEGCHVMRGV